MLRQSERKTVLHCNLGTAFYSVCCNPGAMVILHTPRACSHLALGGYWATRRRAFLRDPDIRLPRSNQLFVTGISDKHAIFGGEALLRKCLSDVSKQKETKYIIVVAGCTAGVIGDDVKTICETAEEETGIPVILVPGAGFMSSHHVQTQVDLLDILLQRFSPPGNKATKEKLAVIFGENRGTANELNIKEMHRLLRYFGFTKILFPPNAMSLEDFASVPDASLFLSVGFSHDHFKIMQDFTTKMGLRYHAPVYTENYPIGKVSVMNFLRNIGQLLGEEKAAEEAVKKEEEMIARWLSDDFSSLRNKKFVCVLGFPWRYCKIENHLRTLKAAGLHASAIILHNDITSAEKEEHKKMLSQMEDLADIPIFEGEQNVEKWIGKTDMFLSTTALVDVPHQLCLSVQQVGSSGIYNLLRKTKSTIEGRGRRITYEY